LSPSRRDASLAVSRIRAERDGTVHRASADIGGERIWFSTRDVELAPAPEALGCAALIPAAAAGRRLRIEAPLDPLWRANAGAILDLIREWWGYRGEPPAPDPGAAADAAPLAEANGPATGVSHSDAAAAAGGAARTALFFSGGVDSFHVLLRSGIPIDLLVMVQGFDFGLDDTIRAEAAERSLRVAAEHAGARSVFIRTNIRTHRRLSRVSWDRTHGSAMAAVAHLLAGQVDRVIIAPSLPGDQEIPWGSHPDLDPLWSGRRVAIVSGPPGNRLDRLRSIAAEPLLRDHLRVCWRNVTPKGNCGRCAKCVLAMLILEECGQLRHSRVFGDTSDLIARVDALRRTPDRFHTLQEMLDDGRLPPLLARAVRDLIHRSRLDMSWPVQLRRRVAGQVLGWLGVERRK
jgi:hypothetical protein